MKWGKLIHIFYRDGDSGVDSGDGDLFICGRAGLSVLDIYIYIYSSRDVYIYIYMLFFNVNYKY